MEPRPGPRLARRLAKPLLFGICLLPAAALVLRFVAGRLGVNPVETLTHETGEWGLRLLLLTLSMTPLRIVTRSIVWLQYRRMLGLFAFFYLSVHFSIYIALDNSFDLGFIWEDIAERPYVTAGFTAFCLLVPLALTSTRGIRQRLGRHWQRLHRLVYPAAVAALLHFVWIQKADYREPLIYASVFLALMVVRSAWTARLLTSLRTHRPLP